MLLLVVLLFVACARIISLISMISFFKSSILLCPDGRGNGDADPEEGAGDNGEGDVGDDRRLCIIGDDAS